VLSTDPTGDADARVVEVRLALDPQDAAKVRQLAGLKVIARFQP
jgi:HlyD family secretion protein